MIKLQHLLKAVVDQAASDLHIVVGAPPVLRINGRIVRVKHPVLSPDDTKGLVYEFLNDAQKAKLEEMKELDLSFELKNLSRFRVNVFKQQNRISASVRRIPQAIPPFERLGLPPVVADFTQFANGLILVTGPTGSGKSTTLAAIIDKINQEKYGHIVTIEDPIEYVHEHKNCIINQREVGPDTWSIQAAVRSLLRQDPDYCLIGELRDLETIEEAIKISETGHLAFGTLHTNSAMQTISRLVNVFPANQQDRIRGSLSFVLQGVLSQRLLPGLDGKVCLAAEVLIPTPAVRNLIRENKMAMIPGVMQTGQSSTGMITMNQSILNLLLKRRIDLNTAFSASTDPEELEKMIKKAGI